ncbi:MAG: glucokinase [Thalassovita sp.]
MQGLVGDIGGTNSRFALVRDGTIIADSQLRFRNDDYASFPEVLRAYLDRIDAPIQRVCIGCAGTVRDGFVRLTNRPWTVGAEQVVALTGAQSVRVLNDLQAQGYALHGLSVDEMENVIPASEPVPLDGTRLSISVGTGVNMAVSYLLDGQVFVPRSESGFIALPVQNAEDLKLLTYLQERMDSVTVEAILSGAGLTHLWRYYGGLADNNGAQVIEKYMENDPVAVAALRRFATVLAQYSASLALTHLPGGGLILAGSVGRAVGPYLQDLGFAEAFLACDRGADVLPKIPVWIAPDVELGLIGCARFLRQQDGLDQVQIAP